jgi:phosphoheptose isomerase
MSRRIDSRGAELVAQTLADASALHHAMGRADAAPVLEAAQTIVDALAAGGKLLVFGNGGSAGDAEHLAAELVGRFERDRRALAAVALTADSSVVTSIGNDEGFERVFARQVEGLGRSGDAAFGISTSGRSANVLAALSAARAAGLKTIALTGRDGGPIGRAADVHVNVPAASTARVQEVHRTLLHVICDLVERAMAQSATTENTVI